jgi:tetratricopeptide (TPR) repeat protein
MSEIPGPKKSRFLKAQFAVIFCIVCVWIIKSGTVEIEGVKAGILKQVVKIDPNNADAHLFLGDCYADLYHYEEAIRGLKEAIKTNPDDAAQYSELGNLYSYLGYPEEAIEAYKQAIKIDPSMLEVRYNLAKVYLEIGEKNLAWNECEILQNLDEETAKELRDFMDQSNSI